MWLSIIKSVNEARQLEPGGGINCTSLQIVGIYQASVAPVCHPYPVHCSMSHRCDRWTFESKATMCSSVIKHSYQVPFEAPATRKFQSGQFDALYQKSCWSVCWYPFDILVIRMILQDLPEKQPCRENQLCTLVALKGKWPFSAPHPVKSEPWLSLARCARRTFQGLPRLKSWLWMEQGLLFHSTWGIFVAMFVRRTESRRIRVGSKESPARIYVRVESRWVLIWKKKKSRARSLMRVFALKTKQSVQDGPGWSGMEYTILSDAEAWDSKSGANSTLAPSEVWDSPCHSDV